MAFRESRWHVALEHKIIRTSIEKGIKTTILAPGMIFGRGSGTGATDTYRFEYAREVLKRGRGFLVGGGSNSWSGSSIGDVSSAIIFVLEETLKDLEGDGKGKIEYGWDGYYFIEAGEASMKERGEIVLRQLKELGGIESEEIDELTVEEVKKIHPAGDLLFGTSSSRSKADRLPALGWVVKDDWREKVREVTVGEYLALKADPNALESKIDYAKVNQGNIYKK